MRCKGLTLGLGMYEWTRRSTPPRRAWRSNQSRVLWMDHQILCRFGQISTDSIHREISDRVLPSARSCLKSTCVAEFVARDLARREIPYTR